MQAIHSLEQWREIRAAFPTGTTVGFVPTMGNLHKGHLSLCARSLSETQKTIVSIFVNPTQFNQLNDFQQYPKTLSADLEQLAEIGVDYCLLPTEEALYPDQFHYRVEECTQEHSLEGMARPGHFRGVLTIVMKLFQLVQPHHAYFGEKDYQQYQLIRGMVDAFFMDIAVHGCPTIRETSGLPYSSRNNRLSATDIQLAHTFAQLVRRPLPLSDIRAQLETAQIRVEYLEIVADRVHVAVHIGGVRLIDNFPLNEQTVCAL